MIWIGLHLPLHFVTTLLLAGLKNALTYYDFGYAFNTVSDPLVTILQQFPQGNFNTTGIPTIQLTAQLSQMDLDPSWTEEIMRLKTQFGGWPGNATVVPRIELLQYLVTVFSILAESYALGLSPKTLAFAQSALDIDPTWIPTTNQTAINQADALTQTTANLTNGYLSAFYTEIFQGVSFFIPCAGGFLFLSCLLTVLKGPPIGVFMWLSWAAQMVGGIALGLLGLLDLGGTGISVTMPGTRPYLIPFSTLDGCCQPRCLHM